MHCLKLSIKQLFIIGAFILCHTVVGYCTEYNDQTLIMGAQKDFLAAVEGKRLVFDALVNIDSNGNLQPGLAKKWHFTEDGKRLTIHLQHGVQYHDGSPFTAKSAVFGIKRAMADAYWSKYIEDIKIIDDHTVALQFNTIYKSFLLTLAGNLVSESFISPTAVDPAWDIEGKIQNYIGTGPFILQKYRKERDATLVKNEHYWNTKPNLSRIIWKYTPDPYSQIMALKAGELDIIGAPEHHSSVPFMKLNEIEKNPQLIVSIQSYGRYQVLEFNCKKPPFDDQKVRTALNWAIDREKMVRSLFGNITDPTYLITDPKFLWGPSNIKKMYGYKPEKARQLLNEAGWIDTNNQGILQKNGRPFEIELLVTTGEANADMVAIVVQSQLKKLGIDLKILTRLDGWDKRLKGEYDLFLHHSGCLPSIPGGIGIGGKYHSKGDWPYAYHSKQLDTLIESVFTTPDNITNERGRLNTIWELLHDASPCIPLYDIKKAVVMNKKVQEFKHGPTMFDMNLTDIIITQ
jgi:peptide/nickel transport system substrate-binding protein